MSEVHPLALDHELLMEIKTIVACAQNLHNSITGVVMGDTIDHASNDAKAALLAELKRVFAGNRVLYCIVESALKDIAVRPGSTEARVFKMDVLSSIDLLEAQVEVIRNKFLVLCRLIETNAAAAPRAPSERTVN